MEENLFVKTFAIIGIFASAFGLIYGVTWFVEYKKLSLPDKIQIVLFSIFVITAIVFTCRYDAVELKHEINVADNTELTIKDSAFFSGRIR